MQEMNNFRFYMISTASLYILYFLQRFNTLLHVFMFSNFSLTVIFSKFTTRSRFRSPQNYLINSHFF